MIASTVKLNIINLNSKNGTFLKIRIERFHLSKFNVNVNMVVTFIDRKDDIPLNNNYTC